MTKSKKSSSLMSYAGTFGALVILCVVLAIASPNFFKYSNMMSVLKQTSFNALVSTGMLLCLITLRHRPVRRCERNVRCLPCRYAG